MSRVDRSRCGRVQPLLALAASQDLGEHASRRLWSHLAGCMPCRRRYSDYLEARAALADLDPHRARPAGVGAEFFAGLQRDIVSRVAAPPPPRARRAWVGAVAAAALVLAGALAFQSWDPRGDGLLHREPIAPAAPRSDFGAQVTPLAYPQGLGARRQLDLLFEEESGLEVTPAGYGGLPSRRLR